MITSHSNKKILWLMSGSIAAFKACGAISQLVKLGFEVQVVASSEALRFVGEATLEGITGRKVATDLYATGSMMDHIHLIRWADLVIVAPATANTINKLAQGQGHDLVGALFLAHKFDKPFLVSPAMNTAMFNHPTTTESLAKLQKWGLTILGSPSGSLACGEVGQGRLMEPDDIVQSIQMALARPGKLMTEDDDIKNSSTSLNQNRRILITAGGTSEKIDAVREITNLSTGKTGTQLAYYFQELGFQVKLLLSQRSQQSTQGLDVEKFLTTESLDQLLQKELSSQPYLAVIHSAAVSDYKVSAVISTQDNKASKDLQHQKISSDDETLTIQLVKNKKILPLLRSYSKNKALKVIGFKLTVNLSPEEQKEKALEQLQKSNVDFCVQNDLSQITESTHVFNIYSKTRSSAHESVEELTSNLATFFENQGDTL